MVCNIVVFVLLIMFNYRNSTLFVYIMILLKLIKYNGKYLPTIEQSLMNSKLFNIVNFLMIIFDDILEIFHFMSMFIKYVHMYTNFD